MIPLLTLPLAALPILIGCAMKPTKTSTAPQFQFKNSNSKSTRAEDSKQKSDATQKSSDRMEGPSSGGGSKEKKGTVDNSSKKGAPIIYTPKRIIEPKTNELTEKEKAIAAGAKKERNEYPTFDDVHSDWEGPLGEMHGGAEKKPVESN
ncbi:hypothetical protein PRIPAC_94402 [Pristionchus pacificus]|uniref:Uncharacterized protein n=1 Tax=Pristionchus pacificus TaxID=54126 RepID=A0A454XLT4_PRIPA|nr:hypothetical protein PRIPAC_94402 [Pristionchus pacificus]|eukprot:PDM65723.1 hypothetical protein PRIPAC_45637 [Pristionchus pacificus]